MVISLLTYRIYIVNTYVCMVLANAIHKLPGKGRAALLSDAEAEPGTLPPAVGFLRPCPAIVLPFAGVCRRQGEPVRRLSRFSCG